MAVTATASRQGKSVGNLKIQTYDCSMDSTYTTNGVTVDLSSEFATVDTVVAQRDEGSTTYVFNYSPGTDASDGLIEVNDMANSGSEVTNGTDLSNITFRVVVIGLE